ncbi:hypothetical protein BZA05DRAFT_389299 [Tricharina praecox]|uniref:uncharacterized protein n=1 Tax=Tricharina praecox TaxID=43433 RepID=UPI0022209A30|nr:uncharacterized protein BZA05DRAFT_389299 [Tricharina praecox]KAI5855670.1 hypothetical protein BZA05DRAFT_389299 [Tricharina praecox]
MHIPTIHRPRALSRGRRISLTLTTIFHRSSSSTSTSSSVASPDSATSTNTTLSLSSPDSSTDSRNRGRRRSGGNGGDRSRRQSLYSIFPPPELAFAQPSVHPWGVEGEGMYSAEELCRAEDGDSAEDGENRDGDAEAWESVWGLVGEPRPARGLGLGGSRKGRGTVEVIGVMEVLVGW